MRTGKKSQEAILGTGIFLIVIGAALISSFALDVTPNMLIAIPVAIMLAGALFLFLSYLRKKVVWMCFLGYFLTVSGLFSLAVCFGSFSVGMYKLWPVLVILCGLSYGASYIQVHHRFSISAAVPSFVLIGLGTVLLCFSLGVFRISFSYFVVHWWPVFLVLLGITLIIIYAYMQHSGKDEKFDDKVTADSDEDD